METHSVNSIEAQKKVYWLPAHPRDGVMSMLRCWRSLAHELPQVRSQWNVQTPFPLPPPDTIPKRLGRISLGLLKYGYYPQMVRCLKGASIAHVLDHSWAHLLHYIPKRIKKVVTVHDLLPLVEPENLTPNQIARFHRTVSSIKLADQIISVSEFTKSEIVRILSIPADRITVIPNGTIYPNLNEGLDNKNFLEAIEKAERGTRRLRVGSIGSILKRKNLDIIPPALAALQERGIKPILLRTGCTLPSAITSDLDKANVPLIEFGKISDSSLEDFYKSIDVLVIPSTFEGFGIPILEGMAYKVPVITTNTSSIPEVGGDAVLYFDPSSPRALCDALIKANEPAIRSTLVALGRERARSFSWENTLQMTFATYDTLR